MRGAECFAELALEHVEEKAHVALSRQIGTPNLASKGKLEARTVLIPTALLDPNGNTAETLYAKKPLVEEVPKTAEEKPVKAAAAPKSILKNSSAGNVKKPLIEEIAPSAGTEPLKPVDEAALARLPPAPWKWTKEGERIKIDVQVPQLVRTPFLSAPVSSSARSRQTHAHVVRASLDVEPRRILLCIPDIYALDINLSLPDSLIGKITSTKADPSPNATNAAKEANSSLMRVRGANAAEALRLKRERDLDVDGARAEWRVKEGRILLWV